MGGCDTQLVGQVSLFLKRQMQLLIYQTVKFSEAQRQKEWPVGTMRRHRHSKSWTLSGGSGWRRPDTTDAWTAFPFILFHYLYTSLSPPIILLIQLKYLVCYDQDILYDQ